jgi:mannose-6-phosphate isomerase-like protein (cupin superfamily)
MHWTTLGGIMSIRGKGRSTMAKAGDTIESPPTGARIVFLKTARDTDGELLQIDDVMKGGGRVAIEHVHPHMEERFEILSGTARMSMRGQERDVGAGETVVVPAGTPHVWGNPHDDEVHLIIEFRPALRMEEWFETFFGLQKDGKVNPNSGLPNALQWAVISREYEDELYLASPPLLVQRVRFGLLATIGKLLGYKARYPKYSAAETARGEGAGQPSTTMVMARAAAMATSVLVASIFLLGRMRRLSKG